MNKSDADYLKFFKDKNLPVYTEADAHEFAATAMHENRSDSRRAAAQKRDKWLYDNLPLYAAAAIQENRDGLIRDLPLQLCRLLYHTASTAPPEHVLQCILQRCEYQSKALVPPFVSTFLPIPGKRGCCNDILRRQPQRQRKTPRTAVAAITFAAFCVAKSTS